MLADTRSHAIRAAANARPNMKAGWPRRRQGTCSASRARPRVVGPRQDRETSPFTKEGQTRGPASPRSRVPLSDRTGHAGGPLGASSCARNHPAHRRLRGTLDGSADRRDAYLCGGPLRHPVEDRTWRARMWAVALGRHRRSESRIRTPLRSPYVERKHMATKDCPEAAGADECFADDRDSGLGLAGGAGVDVMQGVDGGPSRLLIGARRI